MTFRRGHSGTDECCRDLLWAKLKRKKTRKRKDVGRIDCRIGSPKQLSQQMTNRCGKLLAAEEMLFQADSAQLDVFVDASPIALPQLFHLSLHTESSTLDSFLAHSYLSRFGYTVRPTIEEERRVVADCFTVGPAEDLSASREKEMGQVDLSNWFDDGSSTRWPTKLTKRSLIESGTFRDDGGIDIKRATSWAEYKRNLIQQSIPSTMKQFWAGSVLPLACSCGPTFPRDYSEPLSGRSAADFIVRLDENESSQRHMVVRSSDEPVDLSKTVRSGIPLLSAIVEGGSVSFLQCLLTKLPHHGILNQH